MISRDLLFRRQFILGAAQVDGMEGWRRLQISTNLYLTCHGDLNVSTATHDNINISLIGDVLSPEAPASSNEDIVAGIALSVHSFPDLENRIHGLAGRWLLIAEIGEARRLYLDAGATKAAFYGSHPATGMLWVASQPRLLSHVLPLELDEQALAGARQTSFEGWCGTRTPYGGCRQLLPNFCLDLDSGVAVRFWPRGPTRPTGLETAANVIAETIKRTILAASHRRQLYQGLTGGYDSRTLMACAGQVRGQIEYFTLIFDGAPKYDRKLPARLAETLDLRWHCVRGGLSSDAISDVVRRNTGDLLWSSFTKTVESWTLVPDGAFELTGTHSEVLRCFFHKSHAHPENVSAQELERRFGIASDATHRSFQEWLDSIPQNVDMPILDLFYLENKKGTMGGLSHCCSDTIVYRIPPFSNRKIFEVGLSIDRRYRMPPYELHRAVMRLGCAPALEVPFNYTDLWDKWSHSARMKGWRMRARLNRELRFRLRRLAPLDRQSG